MYTHTSHYVYVIVSITSMFVYNEVYYIIYLFIEPVYRKAISTIMKRVLIFSSTINCIAGVIRMENNTKKLVLLRIKDLSKFINLQHMIKF